MGVYNIDKLTLFFHLNDASACCNNSLFEIGNVEKNLYVEPLQRLSLTSASFECALLV